MPSSLSTHEENLETIPLTAYELIDKLAALYPEVIYDPTQAHDEFLLRSGERRLVLGLLALRDREIEDSRGGR